jgi:hypothetical protein
MGRGLAAEVHDGRREWPEVELPGLVPSDFRAACLDAIYWTERLLGTPAARDAPLVGSA